MSISDLSLFIVIGLFSIYALFCAIECGISLVRLFPKLSTAPNDQIGKFLPLWEITNVFLVFSFTGFTNLFNNAIVDVSKAILPLLIVGLVSLLARPSLVLYLFYRKSPTGLTLPNILFSLACFAIPLSFVASGIYLLSGTYFWQTMPGWIIMLAGAVGLAATGLAYIISADKQTVDSKPFWIQFGLTLIWLILLGAALPLALTHPSFSHMLQPRFNTFLGLIDLCLLAFAVIVSLKTTTKVWPIAAAFALLAPILLAWANMPYLLFPSYTVSQAFGASIYANWVLIGLASSVPLTALGLWLFVMLLKKPKPQN